MKEGDKRRMAGELTEATVVSRILACWTCAIKLDLADTADVVFRQIPPPCRNGVPLFDGDFHAAGVCRWLSKSQAAP